MRNLKIMNENALLITKLSSNKAYSGKSRGMPRINFYAGRQVRSLQSLINATPDQYEKKIAYELDMRGVENYLPVIKTI